MKRTFQILVLLLILSKVRLAAQPEVVKTDGKWGVKDKEQVLIKPVYDTIFGFDSTGRICLACFKSKKSSANKFIKVMVTTYSCNYLNKKNERLFIKVDNTDTCSVFSLAKNSVKQYLNSSPYFVASVKNRKYLLNKEFYQLTFRNYQEITTSADPYFYVTQTMNEAENLLTGLVNKKEEEIVPYKYSDIRINPNDSVIIACAAGTRPNAEDDVYDYSGKKIQTSHRHIEMATKNFLIHKVFEPREYYILYNISTKQEKELKADDLTFFDRDEILIRIKNDWYVYDLQTNQKKLKNKS